MSAATLDCETRIAAALAVLDAPPRGESIWLKLGDIRRALEGEE